MSSNIPILANNNESTSSVPNRTSPDRGQQARNGQASSNNNSRRQQLPKKRRKRAGLCRCFSPRNSGDDDDGEVREPGIQSTSIVNNGASSTTFDNLSRDLRQRLVVAADAGHQQHGPAHIRHVQIQMVSSPGRNGRTILTPIEYPLQRRQIDEAVIVTDRPYLGQQPHSAISFTYHLVPDLSSIVNAPYYWGVIDRFEVESLLDKKPEGTFLLRDSAQSDYLFSVSFRRYQCTLHARIEQNNHMFSFDACEPGVRAAATVPQLIQYYKDPAKCLFFEPQLTLPLNRTFVFSLKMLAMAAASVAGLKYSDINLLPVSAAVKDSFRQYHYKHPLNLINLEQEKSISTNT